MNISLRKRYAIGIFVATALWLVVVYLSNLLQLSDRSRYLLGSSQSSISLFNRTQLTEFVFGFSSLVEPFLVVISILLLISLCRRLIYFFQLLGRQQFILYLAAFAPFRLLFRSYASKELLFTLACETLLIYLLSSHFIQGRISFSLRFNPRRLIYSLLVPALSLLACFLLRPFYAIILFVPFMISLSFRYVSPRALRNLLIIFLLCGLLLLFILLFSPNYHFLASFMNDYFLIDGANANSTRLSYEIPDNGLSFILAFFSSLFQPLIGPYLSEVIERPLLLLIFLEGVFFVYFFGLILGGLLSPARLRILSSRVFVILLLSLLYILFVYYIFSIFNFMGGIRFQSCSIPILLYIYAFSASIYNSIRSSRVISVK